MENRQSAEVKFVYYNIYYTVRYNTRRYANIMTHSFKNYVLIRGYYTRRTDMSILIFLDNLNFQIIKVNIFYKIILGETCPAVPPEVRHRLVKPERLSQIKFIAYLLQGAEYLMSAGILTAVSDTGIPQHMIILKNSCP